MISATKMTTQDEEEAQAIVRTMEAQLHDITAENSKLSMRIEERLEVLKGLSDALTEDGTHDHTQVSWSRSGVDSHFSELRSEMWSSIGSCLSNRNKSIMWWPNADAIRKAAVQKRDMVLAHFRKQKARQPVFE